jgi:hypothetical protein
MGPTGPTGPTAFHVTNTWCRRHSDESFTSRTWPESGSTHAPKTPLTGGVHRLPPSLAYATLETTAKAAPRSP